MMKKSTAQIIFVYMYHFICIVMTVMLVGDYADALLIITGILNIILMAVWIIMNIKEKIRWAVYFHFAVGTVAELFLNAGGIVGEGMGLWDLAQLFYICEIIACTLILGFIQFIIWFIRIKKRY